jgi:hypothetical protein
MTQHIQIGARLSPATTGAAIGYRIDTLAGVEHVAFTTSGVVELDVAGAWHVPDLVTVPDDGCIVYWGTSGSDVLTEVYGPAADAATLAALDDLNDLSAAQVRAQVDAALVAAGTSITVISAVSGSAITVRQADTWRFAVTIAGVTLTDYEAVAFGVKRRVTQSDGEALLLVRDDSGLVRIAGAAPASAGNGTLTVDSATAFTVVVHMTETVNVSAKTNYTWYLKGFDTTPAPDEGYTVATGDFTVLGWGVEALS